MEKKRVILCKFAENRGTIGINKHRLPVGWAAYAVKYVYLR